MPLALNLCITAAFGISAYAYCVWYNEEFGFHRARERIHTSLQVRCAYPERINFVCVCHWDALNTIRDCRIRAINGEGLTRTGLIICSDESTA